MLAGADVRDDDPLMLSGLEQTCKRKTIFLEGSEYCPGAALLAP